MNRWIKTALLTALIAGLASYLTDAAVLHLRQRNGTAFRVVVVNQVLVTPLKGQKEEFDLAGQVPVTCARSIFPQLGSPPCWWIERRNAP